MSRFSAIDLTQLPPPDLIETLDFETVLAALLADVTARFAEAGVQYDVGALETDPVKIILEVAAWRETLLRGVINDKARAVLLAYAVGSSLDHLGASFGTARKVLIPATDSSPAVMEGDADYRRRIQLAPEAFSVAGPRGAYVYHALAAAPGIAAAHAFSPAEGRVTVVLAGPAGASVSDQTIALVVDRLALEDIVPLTDVVSVQRATPVPVGVTATITIRRGPDPMLIEAAARERVLGYLASRFAIGLPAFRSGIVAALSAGGVEQVTLVDPEADVLVAETAIVVPGAVELATEVL